ncbi:histone-lysine N-methyltransferase SETMAR-like [Bombus terrestris]|uniref:Histone-lysine N-methyltransferase SETMAR-like n=1 Tax=Bombus terrestris TaxID=30195 RepID=A0A9B2MU36_BOMTE|nr:histone-lysine N-methyltransferase SETMAR-like [Bombus terrestris]
MVSKLNVWVPHELTERNRLERTTACMSLLARNKHEPFLKRLVTGDEKWILYENPERKRSWSQRNQPPQRCAKPGLHPLVIPLIQTKYCTQLEKLREAEKRPGIVNRSNVIFHHDNARPHVAKGVIKNCLNLIRKFYHIPHIPQTLPHLITTCSEHYNTF